MGLWWRRGIGDSVRHVSEVPEFRGFRRELRCDFLSNLLIPNPTNALLTDAID